MGQDRGRVFLAVDGGLITTEGMLVDPSGEVLARARLEGVSPRRIGAEATAAVIADLHRELANDAGLGEDTGLARIGAFIAGIDLPSEREEAREALQRKFGPSDLIVENDTHAVLWAGMRRPAGAAVFCGDGINAIARSATGKTAGYLSLGTISGEWGGALSLGRAALFAASRAEDGRGPQTDLRYLVAAHLARPTVRAAVAQLHLQGDDDRSVAALARAVFTAESQGDEIAAALVDRLASEVVGMTAAALKRALVAPSGSDIVLAGWILTAGYDRLDRMLNEQFAAQLPGATVSRLDLPLVAGAALACIAADHGGPVRKELHEKFLMGVRGSPARSIQRRPES